MNQKAMFWFPVPNCVYVAGRKRHLTRHHPACKSVSQQEQLSDVREMWLDFHDQI